LRDDRCRLDRRVAGAGRCRVDELHVGQLDERVVARFDDFWGAPR
jgi:hypothetical protein